MATAGDDTQKTFDKHGFQGGSQQTAAKEKTLPVQKVLKREQKWRDMLENWDFWMQKRFSKVRDRCRKGIPDSLRARAWQYLCGGRQLMLHYRGRFQELEQLPGDPKWLDDIEKDLDRQFPEHELFIKKVGQGELFRVLKAYSILQPSVGYCQAQAPIAALFLMHMPAEDAFWCLVAVCDKYLTGYYSPGLEAVQLDGAILFSLLRRVCPTAHAHMTKHGVEPIMFCTEWLMCAFARTLTWSCVLRVWDMFLCEGIRVIFKVGLVVVKLSLGNMSKKELKKKCPGAFETLDYLRKTPPTLDEDLLIEEVLNLEIGSKDLIREHQRQIDRRRQQAKNIAKEAANSRSNGNSSKR